MRVNQETHAVIRRAKKGRGFLIPKFSMTARRFMIIIGGAYLRLVEGVKSISFIHEERIIQAMEDFHDNKQRLIFVFRHAAEEDPPVLMHAFNHPLRRRIEKRGRPSHALFLYGRDVPNWAGPAAATLFPRIGAIPVQNRGGNTEALNILRREMRDGAFPIALAPEEQIVYHMYHTFDIAPGISSLVRWGQEGGKPVAVVPLSIGYSYGRDPERFIRRMLERWEDQTGISLGDKKAANLHPLLVEAADRTIALLEAFYGLPEAAEEERSTPRLIDLRIERLCEAVLSAAEKAAGLPSDGDRMDRLFRIRYAGVENFYPEDLDPKEQPALQRGLLDFKALKAEVSIRHSQIIDVLGYIHLSYITPPFSAGRGCEFILNLLDLINRVRGGDISGHYTPPGQNSVILAGEPLIYNAESNTGLGRREYLERIRDEVKEALQRTSCELENSWEKVKLR